MKVAAIACLAALAACASAMPMHDGKVRYDNHVVYRLDVANTATERLNGLAANTDGKSIEAIYQLWTNNSIIPGLDWWHDPQRGQFADVRVPPAVAPQFLEYIEKHDISSHVMIENVQAVMDEESARLAANRLFDPATMPASSFPFDQYNTLEDIQAWILALPQQYPGLATPILVSQSFEGRDIYVVKVTGKSTNNVKNSFWFDGGIHAREWIAPATVIYMLGAILDGYGKVDNITQLVDSLDLYVMPVFNVDGYKYTFTNDRMWRKTRSTQPGVVCVGVDPNRNWAYEWDGAGTSNDPCDDSYSGPKAFSEVEVRTVGEYITNLTTLNGYINFHSYSQLWMSPWGYTNQLPKDYTTQNTLSKMAVGAIATMYGTKYQYGPIATTIYPASGSSADYTYGVSGIVYSYGVELRDTGAEGFLLDPSQIIPSGKETLQAILVMGQYLVAHPRKV